MICSEEMRERLSREAVGKTVQSLEWVEPRHNICGYWVMTFTDRSEISIRFMSEVRQFIPATE